VMPVSTSLGIRFSSIICVLLLKFPLLKDCILDLLDVFFAASERALPEPRVCQCENGGLCRERAGLLECDCPAEYLGSRCELLVGGSRTGGLSGGVAPILIPILVLLLLALGAGAAFYVYRKRPL